MYGDSTNNILHDMYHKYYCNCSFPATMYNVNPSDVILVHDDLDRPVGKYSLKQGGSAG